MNKPFKKKDSTDKKRTFSAAPKGEQDVSYLIKKVQQQLTFLERKIDTLIEQSSGRPSRSFDRSSSFDKGRRPNRTGERSFSSGRSFNKKPVDGNRAYAPRKKSFSPRKRDDS